MLNAGLRLWGIFTVSGVCLGLETFNKNVGDSQHCNDTVITENIPAAAVSHSVGDTQSETTTYSTRLKKKKKWNKSILRVS